MTAYRNNLTIMAAAFMAVLCLSSILCRNAPAEDKAPALIAGISKEEALKLGERIYREGILPSGEHMPALVQGDIPVDSTMFSCVSCHLRSGLGSLEGRVVTYPIDGVTLFKPISKAWDMRWVAGSRYARATSGDLRSAYDDKTLAAAIRGGVNPDGKTLNYTMPRYPLDDKDMDILIFYLRNLSTVQSPGVSDSGIRFATVVTDDVSQADREAATGPLETLVYASKGGKSSRMARLSLASDPENLMNKGYVTLSMATWQLKGPSSGWRDQLEDYHKKGPVFALIGGIGKGDWSPVHAFCEENKVPCILPVTDLPVISDKDWYTIYVSKGLYQEGEAAAKYLNGVSAVSSDMSVIQVYRNSVQGLALAKGFEETWTGLGLQKPENHVIRGDDQVTTDFLKRLTPSMKRAIILLWLDSKDFGALASFADMSDSPQSIILSATLLGRKIYEIPDNLRKSVFIAYPYRMPDDLAKFFQTPSFNKDSSRDPLADYSVVRSKASLTVMLVSKSIFMLKGYFFRDRFLEVMDMMQDERMTPLYPRLSFGPGQRYISKGCYIVQIGEGPAPKVVPVSDWVIQ